MVGIAASGPAAAAPSLAPHRAHTPAAAAADAAGSRHAGHRTDTTPDDTPLHALRYGGRMSAATRSTPIRRVAVLGAGVMGSGIAAHCANAGIPVVLLDIVPPKLSDADKKSKAKRDGFAAGALRS